MNVSAIAILQGIGHVNGIPQLNFTLTDTGAKGNVPFFTYRLQMLGRVQEGTANSKKGARNEASLQMLRSILDDPRVTIKNRQEVEDFLKENEIQSASSKVFDPRPFTSCDTGKLDLHPVCLLDQICSKKQWNLATYDISVEEGALTNGKFVCKCTIDTMKVCTTAQNSSKKLAKNSAAQAMLTKLLEENLFSPADLLDETNLKLDGPPKAHGKKNAQHGQGGNVDEVRLTFMEILEADRSLTERVRELVPLPFFVDQHFFKEHDFTDAYKLRVEQLITEITEMVECRIDVNVVASRDVLSEFHCYAVMYIDFTKQGPYVEALKQNCPITNPARPVDVLASFGMDLDLDRAKFKAKRSVIDHFLFDLLAVDEE